MAREILLPLITSAPHNSTDLGEYHSRIQLTQWQRGEFSDRYTADTARHPHALANEASISHRLLGDLNRPRDAEDVFREKDFLGNDVWKPGMELAPEEKEALLQMFYDPHFERIDNVIAGAMTRRRAKTILLFGMHDTGDFNPETNERGRKLPKEDRSMPLFIISNNGLQDSGEVDPEKGYITAPAGLMQQVQDRIAHEFGLSKEEVEINTSYKGGHEIQYFGNPDHPSDAEIWAVQIEYNRHFVMDQKTRTPRPKEIVHINTRFNRIFKDVCQNAA